jgi:hypothetical protein
VPRQPLFLWLTGLCFAVLATPLAHGEDPPPSVLSAEHLKSRILEEQKKVHSFHFVYRSEPGAYPSPPNPPGTYVYWVVAAKAPDRMYFVLAHGYDGFDSQDDPGQKHVYLTAKSWVSENPVNRSYTTGSLGPQDELPDDLAQGLVFCATGLWPCDAQQPLRLEGRSIVLREVAASPKYSTVRPRQELVDGRWCHVLENEGVERLWIDTEHGCALLARETYYGNPPVLTQRLEASGHREVAPGVWLPSWLRNIQYNWRARTEAARQTKIFDALHRVLEARANDVDDRLFEFRPRPGSLNMSQGTTPVQTEPGGLDHVEDTAAWILRNRQVRPPEWEWEPYVAGLPVLVFIVAFEFWLYWRRHSRPAGQKRDDLAAKAVFGA